MAQTTMEAIAEFTKNDPKHVKEIRVCIFDRKFLDIYHDEMQKIVVEGKKPAAGWRKKISNFGMLSAALKDKCYYSQRHLANCSRTASLDVLLTQPPMMHLSYY